MSAPRWLCCRNRLPAEVWACGLLTLGTVVAFCQVVQFDFVNYDDPVYVYNNLNLRKDLSVDTFRWAFGETHKSAHWHPLTWLSLALDYQMYGLNAGGFHLTNLLLHVANTLLLFWVLRLSTGMVWRSAAVAGLFGWHPLHVESVAWITERKDVLSTFFWMLTMLAYVKYVQRRCTTRFANRLELPTDSPESRFARQNHIGILANSATDPCKPCPAPVHRTAWLWYVLMVLFFALGLLSKPMIVTLPCVLLLWDFWPLQRPTSWKLLLEKAPLFALALTSGIWTSVVMHEGTVRRTGEILTIGGRVGNFLLAAGAMLRKMILPYDLCPYYPVHPGRDVAVEATSAGIFLAFCTFLAIAARRKRPYLLMGWLWYLGTIVLVSLRLQAGSFTWADRYTYVPMIGIFIAVVWGLSDWLAERRTVLIAALTGWLLICLGLTWQQVRIWQNSETLWTHTLQVTEQNFLAHYDLALYWLDQQRPTAALPHLEQAARILPKVPEFHFKLGQVHLLLGAELEKRQHDAAETHGVVDQLTLARVCFARAVILNPRNPAYVKALSQVDLELARFGSH